MCEEQDEAAEDSPGAFVSELIKELEASEGTDGELTAILKRHLLKAEPADSCVGDALTAITELAAARVAGPVNGEDGEDDADSDSG